MEIVQSGKWVLEVDREATIKAYSATPSGGSDTCTCLYCQNFAAAREQAFPAEFLALLEQLGIDYRKDAEVWECSAEHSLIRFYGGWFHFVGRIISVDEHEKPDQRILLPQTNAIRPGGEERIRNEFFFYFVDKDSLAHHSFQGYPLVQLDFGTDVPWVLDQPPI